MVFFQEKSISILKFKIRNSKWIHIFKEQDISRKINLM
jgi:hypothetical protein